MCVLSDNRFRHHRLRHVYSMYTVVNIGGIKPDGTKHRRRKLQPKPKDYYVMVL